MIIDDKVVNNMINESSETHYILELYNIYVLSNDIVDGDFNNRHLLKKLEDEIFTIDNNVLSEQERLSVELKKIIRYNEKNTNEKNKTIISKRINNILEVMDEVFDNSLDDNYIIEIVKERLNIVRDEAIFSMKKKIAIIEAELNIPICFFEAASISFMDLYKKYYKNDFSLKKGNGE